MKIVIFGNSGSGKTTLAHSLTKKLSLAHLDLDTIAWDNAQPPKRKSAKASEELIVEFVEANPQWVIEGCYSDLLTIVMKYCSEIIFLNPGVEVCLNNCINRPWEPHKYSSLEAQNQNLGMLLEWVRQYEIRTDEFSLDAHREIFDAFAGKKTEYGKLTKL